MGWPDSFQGSPGATFAAGGTAELSEARAGPAPSACLARSLSPVTLLSRFHKNEVRQPNILAGCPERPHLHRHAQIPTHTQIHTHTYTPSRTHNPCTHAHTHIHTYRCTHIHKQVKGTQLCLTLCDPMDYTIHGILQARILEWAAVLFSRGSSQPRNGTQVSHCGQILYQLSHQGNPGILEWVAYPFSRGSSQPRDGTQVSHCGQILYQLSHQGNPGILEWVAYPFSRGSSQPRGGAQVSLWADSLSAELTGKPNT